MCLSLCCRSIIMDFITLICATGKCAFASFVFLFVASYTTCAKWINFDLSCLVNSISTKKSCKITQPMKNLKFGAQKTLNSVAQLWHWAYWEAIPSWTLRRATVCEVQPQEERRGVIVWFTQYLLLALAGRMVWIQATDVWTYWKVT